MSTSIFRRQTLKRVTENIRQKENTYSLLAAIASELEWLGIRNEIVENTGVLAYIWGGGKGKTTMLYTFLDGEFMPEQVSAAVSAAAHFQEIRAKLDGEIVFFFRTAQATAESDNRVEERLADLRVQPENVCAQQFDIKLKTGEFAVTNAPIMPGSFKFEVLLTGKGGHGSAPSGAVNPIDCFAAVSSKIFELEQKYKSVDLKINSANAGTVCNIIPQSLKFTASAAYFLNARELNSFLEELLRSTKILAENYECKLEFKLLAEPTLPFYCSELCVLIAKSALEPLGGFSKNAPKAAQIFVPYTLLEKPFVLLQTGLSISDATAAEVEVLALEYAYNALVNYLQASASYKGNSINAGEGV